MIPLKLQKKGQKINKTQNPWLLESVENGIKATNIHESAESIRQNNTVPVQYFEYDRLFGRNAFHSPLKVMEMFGELQEITPRTKGFIFGSHKYLYHGRGILRVNYQTGKESFYSEDTLRNENVSCYLSLVESTEEDIINSVIEELDAATSGCYTEDSTRKRIPYSDQEQQDT